MGQFADIRNFGRDQIVTYPRLETDSTYAILISVILSVIAVILSVALMQLIALMQYG